MPPEPSSRHVTAIPTAAPESDGTLVERAVGAATREALRAMARGGGTRGLWVAVAILTAAYGSHIFFGQDLNSRVSRTEDYVVWLVECKLAEQRGEACDPLPLGIR